MSQNSDQMELREEDIRGHYAAALGLLDGFDHSPRIATGGAAPVAEKSPGIGSVRRFRSTTPGLSTRRVTRAEGIQLSARVEAIGGDGLPSPIQAHVLQGLRRAIAIALAVADQFADRTALKDLKRANLEGALAENRKAEFSELLTAEALITLYVFGSATAFLLASHATEQSVEVGEVEEVLVENGQLALHGVLWELDQDIAALGTDEHKTVAVVLAFAEALMEKVASRAASAARLEPFVQAAWRVEADEFSVRGFSPATKGKSSTLTMTFKKPNEVVGNHIAKYQSMKLAKMLMAYDFDRRLNPFAELGGFIFTFMGDGKPGTGKTTLIQMMAGLVNDYCQTAGYPFKYQNLSTDNIDSYHYNGQLGLAKNGKPKKIGAKSRKKNPNFPTNKRRPWRQWLLPAAIIWKPHRVLRPFKV